MVTLTLVESTNNKNDQSTNVGHNGHKVQLILVTMSQYGAGNNESENVCESNWFDGMVISIIKNEMDYSCKDTIINSIAKDGPDSWDEYAEDEIFNSKLKHLKQLCDKLSNSIRVNDDTAWIYDWQLTERLHEYVNIIYRDYSNKNYSPLQVKSIINLFEDLMSIRFDNDVDIIKNRENDYTSIRYNKTTGQSYKLHSLPPRYRVNPFDTYLARVYKGLHVYIHIGDPDYFNRLDKLKGVFDVYVNYWAQIKKLERKAAAENGSNIIEKREYVFYTDHPCILDVFRYYRY
ncbi:hypothetical protein BN7_5256 [Wickerhamomyces ciferrii]|uniref:Uncharacterized protein n=1 Tax=Wickerhamomyces ciferrii (strain ATCC 14091 / BCRC 22168 / CBS 111 / JCM 3599 / NBRC 0793 / NRRL Y-1031 F-60-10) TaxID=1206466 RepID=K0KR90_WICCF|nr:uncharacterized protein BN7_5256 [Wickerhamomyces ciferrii]CCH45671.1 hypothetical protein BN7_5256 [Wickerhamomyces ciferrii]